MLAAGFRRQDVHLSARYRRSGRHRVRRARGNGVAQDDGAGDAWADDNADACRLGFGRRQPRLDRSGRQLFMVPRVSERRLDGAAQITHFWKYTMSARRITFLISTTLTAFVFGCALTHCSNGTADGLPESRDEGGFDAPQGSDAAVQNDADATPQTDTGMPDAIIIEASVNCDLPDSGDGGPFAFMDRCNGVGDAGGCAPGLECVEFPQLCQRCTHPCAGQADCEPPSAGCSLLSVCEP